MHSGDNRAIGERKLSFAIGFYRYIVAQDGA